MSKYFLAGVGSILLSGVLATLLMVANAQPFSGPADACAFSSGYGVGAAACNDASELTVSPKPTFRNDVADMAAAETVDRD